MRNENLNQLVPRKKALRIITNNKNNGAFRRSYPTIQGDITSTAEQIIAHFDNTRADLMANGVCRFCKKTFCCAKCRDRHVDKVHPNVNADCSLCASEILPLRQCESTKLNLEDEKLLSHIVDNHLPLRCRLCGDLFESREDFKFIAACKWFERWHCLTSPSGHEHLGKKSKQYSVSESDCNGSTFCTPPEIYRKTSTPMLLGQKADFETLCVPEFSFKTPNSTNSQSIAQIPSISKTSDTQFFSCLLSSSNEKMTPFRTCGDEQFPRSNSGRKLTITEEEDNIAHDDAGKTTANVKCPRIEVSSHTDMDLTRTEGGILQQDSPKTDDVREDVVKKVRFSDQYKTAAELKNLTEPCVRTVLNMSEEDDFHDAHNASNAQKAKATKAEDTKDAKSAADVSGMEDVNNVADVKNMDNSRKAEDRKRSLVPSTSDSLNNSQIRIIRDNTKNMKKENPEVSNVDSSTASQVIHGDSKRVVMMVVLESDVGGLTTDLMPLISSGLKKLQEQLTSANCQPPSNAAESAKVCRRSITTMKMSVESVENYSTNGAATMTNRGQLVSPSSSSVQSDETISNSGGFLSTVSQAMKHALRSFSVSSLRIPRSIEATEVIRRQEIVEEITATPGPSSDASQVRRNKRSREVSSREDPVPFALDTRSPLAKRHRGWYKMIRGRQPINRMRNNRVTSPRGVSTETQIFSQGSLTVGDTVLPLPTRAHQSTE
ncbi:PREDICTED: uncharacterized protein LOC105456290 [Wasmannia auropunctata]|uniref:uncharacterized protein LOC105456290 n=1 Tax=Wasmannia auropunctata TaxID=64793 RepID=UPI0005EE4FBF|nr:PREDICTED: uncharacterized protein LOC105456290 [Wasmannia auropunctata]